MRKSAGHLSHCAETCRVRKLGPKLLQARFRPRMLSDFGSQLPIGLLCLRGALRDPLLESLVKMLQFGFAFFLLTDV